MENIVKQLVEYKPFYTKCVEKKHDKDFYGTNSMVIESKEYYEVSFYCEKSKTIHTNLKSVLQCKNCVSELDKMEYEALQRMEWFLDGYYIHNLGKQFSKIKTEDICKNFNIKLNYFRPWI